jgi:hypothetical protein
MTWKVTIPASKFRALKLKQREDAFKKVCASFGLHFDQPPYAVMFEDFARPGFPVQILTPSPEWWAMALHGHILPPVEVYWALAEDEATDGWLRHSRGFLLHQSEPVGPMTPEEAMLSIIKKDVPRYVWDRPGANRPHFKIVPREMIPTDRTHRNAWRLAA